MLLRSLPTRVHLSQLSVILLCSSLQLGNICILITDRLTHFLIKFVLLMAPLSTKNKSTSRVSPPLNPSLICSVVFISCAGNGIPQMYGFLNAHENFWNDMTAWLFNTHLTCFTPSFQLKKRVWRSQNQIKNVRPSLQAIPNFSGFIILGFPSSSQGKPISATIKTLQCYFPSLSLCKHFNLQLENSICPLFLFSH